MDKAVAEVAEAELLGASAQVAALVEIALLLAVNASEEAKAPDVELAFVD